MIKLNSTSSIRPLLVLVISFFLLAAWHLLFSADKMQTAHADAGGTTIFFKNVDNWSQPYVYYWYTQNGNTMNPGWTTSPAMQRIGGSGTGSWWAYTVPGSTTSGIIFKDSNIDPPANRTNNQNNITSNSFFVKTSGSGQVGGSWTSSIPDSDSTVPAFTDDIWITGTSTGGTQLTLNWKPATDNSGIERYEIFRDGALVGTMYPSTQNTTKDTYKAGVTQYVIPASYSFQQTGLTATTTYKYEIKVFDYKGLSSMSNPIYISPGAYARTITFDGWNDFRSNSPNTDQNETFTTTQSGHTFFLTWDSRNIYYGYYGNDIPSTVTNAGDKYILSYVGGSGGTTNAIDYSGQQPMMPFAAKHHLRFKIDGTFYNRQVFNGTSWTNGKTYTGENWTGSDTGKEWSRQNAAKMVEFRIPREDLGLNGGTSLQWVSSIIYQNASSSSGATWAGVPYNSFTAGEGWDKGFDLFYEFDLTSKTAAAAQWYNYEFRKNTVNGKSVSFLMKGGYTGASSVKIQQSVDGGYTWTDSSLVNPLTASSSSAIVKGLQTNTAYKFRLVVSGGTFDGSSTIESLTTIGNTSPVATSGSLNVTEDIATSGTLSGTDVDYDNLTYSIVSQPSKGTVTITNAATGAYTYTPNLNATGADSFTFKVNDGTVDSVAASVTVSIASVNDVPAISDIANQTINEDGNTGSLAFTVSDVETAAASLSVSATSNNQALIPDGNLSIGGSAGNRNITVTPAANESGSAIISITVSDGTGTSTETFTVTVTAVNDAPTVSNVTDRSTAEDTATGAISFTVGDLDTSLANLTMSGSSNNTTLIPNGNITFGGSADSRTVTITPAANQTGNATVTITVSDGQGGTASDTFLLTVTAVNDGPTISDIANQLTNEDTIKSGIIFNIGDIDTPNNQLTVTASSADTALVPNANLQLGGSGTERTLSVTPAANRTGSVTITVTVSDGSLTASDTFLLTVNSLNDAPTISDIANQTTNEDTATAAIAITVNDIDTNVTSLTLSGTSSDSTLVANQNIVFAGSGANRTVTITPTTGRSGSVTITITVSDGQGGTATDTFTLTVHAVNDAPFISDIADRSVNEDTVTSQISFTVSDEETLAAGLIVTVSSSNPTLVPNGNLSLGGVGGSRHLTITPAANQHGTTTITVTVSDGQGGTTSDTFLLTVTPINDNPTLTTISTITGQPEDTATTITYAALLAAANEADIDGDTISFRIGIISSGILFKGETPVTENSTTLSLGESLTWTPALHANGTLNAFTVRALDSASGLSATPVTVTVSVAAVNDAPVLNAMSSLTGAVENSLFEITHANLLAAANITDVDSSSFVFRMESAWIGTFTKGGTSITAGVTTVSAGESIIWNHGTLDATGTFPAFTVKVGDGQAFSTATVTVSIVATDDTTPPTFPTGLTVTDHTISSITFSWNPVSDAGLGTVRYIVFFNGENQQEVSGTSLTISDLPENRTYSGIIVRAKDQAGNISGVSAAISARTKDGTIPNAPSNPEIGNKSGTGFELSWTAGTDNPGGSGVKEYEILVGENIHGPTANTSITITGLAEFTLYEVKIRTVDMDNNKSAWTSPISVRTYDTSAPTSPETLAASGINATVFTVSWGASTDNVGVVSYEVYFDNNPVPVATVTGTSYSASGLLINTPVVVTIKAIDAAGNHSAASTPLTVTPVDNTAPTAPTALIITSKQETQFQLTWTASTDNVGVVQYQIKVNGILKATILPSGGLLATTYLVTGVEEGNVYQVEVIARDARGLNSPPGTISVSMTDVDAPVWPTPNQRVLVSRTFQTLTVSWTAATDVVDGVAGTGVQYYNVIVTGGPGAGTFVSHTTQHIITGLRPNTQYSITIVAVDGGGMASIPTSPLIAKTVLDVHLPTKPNNFELTAATPGTVSLSWAASTDNDVLVGYHVYGRLKLADDVYRAPELLAANVAGTVTTVSGLLPDREYKLFVRSVDRSGNLSTASDIIEHKMEKDLTPPLIPFGFVPTASQVTESSVRLSWSGGFFDNVDSVARETMRFEVFVDNVRLSIPKIPFRDTQYVITGLKQDTVYQFKVRAIDSSGNVSDYSGVLSQKTNKDNVNPTKPSVTTSKAAVSTQTITWTAAIDSNLFGYEIHVAKPQGDPKTWSFVKVAELSLPLSSLSYTIRGLDPGVADYKVKVIAVDAAGNTNESVERTFATELDETPPSVPSGIEVERINASSFTLTWEQAKENHDLAGYEVYILPASANAATPWTKISGSERLQSTTFTVTSDLVSGLNDSTGIYYRVVAYDDSGNASVNKKDTVRTGLLIRYGDLHPPVAPAAVSVVANTVAATELELTWTPTADDTTGLSSGVVRYDIYKGEQKIGSTALNRFKVTGLMPNTEYSGSSALSVRAVDGAGNESAKTPLTTVKTLTDQLPPAQASVRLVDRTFKSLTFTLSATDNVGVTGFEYRVGNNGAFLPASSPLVITGLIPGSTTNVQVRAIDAAGNRSARTTKVSGTTIDDRERPMPPILGGQRYVDTVLLRWKSGDDNFEVKGYRVYRVNGSRLVQIGEELAANVTSFEVTGLMPDTSYRFMVRTVDLKNNLSVNSNIAVFTTDIDRSFWTPQISVKTPIDETEGNDGSKVTIEWTKLGTEPFLFYELFLNGVVYTSTKPSSVEEWTIDKLQPQTTYTLVIRYKVTDNVYSSFSNPLTINTAPDRQKPYGLSAGTTTNIKAGSLKLRWNPAEDNVAVDEYKIYNGETEIGTTPFNEFTVTGLSKATDYNFKIVALDSSDNPSDPVTIAAKTAPDTTAPTPPAAGQFSVSDAVRSGLIVGFKVTWEAAVDDTVEESEIIRYHVFLNGVRVTKNQPITTHSYTFSGLKYGMSYKIAVTAIDNDNNESSRSAAFRYTTLRDEQPPTAPTALVANDLTSVSTTLTWRGSTDDIGVVRYAVKVNGAVVSSTKRTRATVRLFPGVEQTVTVHAYDEENNESAPATIVLTTANDEQNPEAPTGLVVQYPSSTGSIRISWSPAIDNDRIKKYMIKDSYDNSTIVEETLSLNHHEMAASALNGRSIYVVAVDRSDNQSVDKFVLKINAPTGVSDLEESVIRSSSSSPAVQFKGLYTKTVTSVSYRTRAATTMSLKLYRDANLNGEKDNGELVNTVMNNELTPAGSRSIRIPTPVVNATYIIEYVITSGTQTREYNALFIVDKAPPIIAADTGKIYTLTDIGPSASTTVDIEYTVSKNMFATVFIENEKNDVVRYIHRNQRILKRTLTNYVFTWNGKTLQGADVPDGKYKVEFSGVDLLGYKAPKKTVSVMLERFRPQITGIRTHLKPGLTHIISYELSEDVVIANSFKLCATEPTDTNGNGKIDLSECNVVEGSDISSGEGAKRDGENRFVLRLSSMPANGTTYYLWMDVRDLSNRLRSLAKDNAVKVFPITFDNVRPVVSGFTVSHLIGSDEANITYHLSENARVTAVIRSGESFERSKVVRQLLKNQFVTASTDENDKKTLEWDGKNDDGELVPNSTNRTKYFIELRVSDPAGNTHLHTESQPSWLEVRKEPAPS